MNAPLYNTEILRLAASIPHQERLAEPMGSVGEALADLRQPGDGRCRCSMTTGASATSGMLVRACALGQASSALLAAHVIGKTPEELAAARDALTAWLAGERERRPTGRGSTLFTPALPHTRAPSPRSGWRSKRRPKPPRPRARRALMERERPRCCATACCCSASRWSSCCCSAGSGWARRWAISSPARWSGRRCSGWSAMPKRRWASPSSASRCCCSSSGWS